MMSGRFEIIDDAELVVAGYASTAIEDRAGDRFTPDMLREPANKYLETPIVFYCHMPNRPAGIILKEYRSPDGRMYRTHVDDIGWYVVSRVSDARPDVKTMIREGILTGYSIGGQRMFNKIMINDVSYVPRPLNKLSYHKTISEVKDDIHQRIRNAKSFEEAAKIIEEERDREQIGKNRKA